MTTTGVERVRDRDDVDEMLRRRFSFGDGTPPSVHSHELTHIHAVSHRDQQRAEGDGFSR